MKEHIEDLARTKLFSGIEPKEIAGLLECLHARCVHYAKDEMIVEDGSFVSEFGVMLSGHGRSIKWDASDKVITITLLQKGSEIGVMLAASPNHKSPVAVQAEDDCFVLFIPYDRLIARCQRACGGHERLLRNYIGIVAEKGLVLHERITCLLKPSLREKVLTRKLKIPIRQAVISIMPM